MFQSLKLLSPLIYGFLKVQDTNKVGEECALGKHERGYFLKNEAWRPNIFYNWCIVIFVDQCKHKVWVKILIFSSLLMIFLYIVGYSFLNTKIRHLTSVSRLLKLVLRTKVGIQLSV